MAFRFNQIDEQMSAPQQSNIFDSQGGGSGAPSAGGQGSMPSGGGSFGGFAGSGGAGGNAMGAPKAQQSGGAPSSGQVSAFKANAARAKAPDAVVQSAKSGLAAADQKLQSEANSYNQKAGQTASGYGIDKGEVERAASGVEGDMSKVGQRLSGGKPQEFEAFKGLGSDTPTDADRFMNPSSLYAGQSQGYTSGLGRYDGALLRNNRDFRNIQSQLKGEQERIKQESDQKTKDLTEKARAQILSGYEKGNTDIREYLDTLGQDTLKRAKDQELAEDQKRGAMRGEDLSAQKYAEIMKNIDEDFARTNPDSLQARAIKNYGQNPMDLAKYFNFDRDTDWREFVNQDEVDRFNRIQGLIGGKDILTAPDPAGAGDPYSFDEQGAQRAIMDSLVGQQTEADRLAAEQAAAEEAKAIEAARGVGRKVKGAQKKIAQKTKRIFRSGGMNYSVDPQSGLPVGIGPNGVDDPYKILT